MLRLAIVVAVIAAMAVSAQAAGTDAAQQPQCYFSPGWHGGYYLTDEDGFARCLDALFRDLQAAPNYKAAMEIEPYTLERMLGGERFAVERRGREKPVTPGWAGGGPGKYSIQYLAAAAHSGKQGVRLTLTSGDYVNLAQTLDARELGGVTLRLSAWIRARGGNAHFYIDAHRGTDFIANSNKQTPPAPLDGKWHHVGFDYVAPAGADILYPQVRITNGPGEADFDDISMVRTDTGKELLRNPGLEAGPIPTLKDVARLDLLRKYARAGRLEFIGGAYTQPIMYTLGQESVAHQFVLGQRAEEEALGEPVRVYAAQEPDWCGQLPQILTQAGIRYAAYRTCWQAFGAAPAKNAEIVWWRGPDGTRIDTSPMPPAMREGWGVAGPSFQAVEKLRQAGLRQPYFLDLADYAPEWVPSPSAAKRVGVIGGLANYCGTVEPGPAVGQDVVLSAYLRSKQSGVHLYIDAYHGAASLGGVISPYIDADGQWHRVVLRFHVPPSADRLYPQARIFLGAPKAEMDIAALKLTVANTGHVLAGVGDLAGPDLPKNWGAGGFQGATAKASLVEGGAPEGKGYLRVDINGTMLKCDLVTPSQYFRAAGTPTQVWNDAYAHFEHRFPFGILAGENLLSDRRAEDLILTLGRADAMGLLKTRPDLEAMWELLMIGHHHDVWVCAPVPAFGIWSHGYKRFADLTHACDDEVTAMAKPDLAQLSATPDVAAKQMTAISLAPMPRTMVTPVRWLAPEGLCRAPLIVDDAGNPVPASLEIASKYPDGSAKEITGSVLVDLPAGGWRTYSLRDAGDRKPPALRTAAARMNGDTAVLDNGLLRVEIGPEGVQILREGKPLLSSPARLAGQFADGPHVSHFTKVSARREGVDAVAVAVGKIANVGLNLRVSLAPYAKTAGVAVTCDFGKGTRVGEGPEQLPLMATWSHEDLKLRWVFRLAWANPRYLVHGAFELRKPEQPILPITGMALAQGDGGGLAIYTDRTTSGVFREDPASLAVILAFGGKFIYAPNENQLLTGKHTYALTLYPYSGSLEDAGVAAPVCGTAAGDRPGVAWRAGKVFPKSAGQLVSIAPANGAVITDCERQGSDLVVRLWRPYSPGKNVTVTVAGAKSLSEADLAGRATKRLALGPAATIPLRFEQIMTIRAAGLY